MLCYVMLLWRIFLLWARAPRRLYRQLDRANEIGCQVSTSAVVGVPLLPAGSFSVDRATTAVHYVLL